MTCGALRQRVLASACIQRLAGRNVLTPLHVAIVIFFHAISSYQGYRLIFGYSTPVFGGQNETRREEYHYDGVRRIQELVRREIAVAVVPGGEGGEPNPEGAPGDPVPSGGLGLEEPAEVLPGEPLVPIEIVTALPAGWDQREYVRGPDYVDELAWQIDKDGKPYYALLDANYNVMALVAGASVPPASNDPSGTQSVPAGKVIEQFVWSPYGELLSRDVLDRTTLQLMTDSGTGTAGASLPGIRNKVGHQGLFFERFDGVNTDPALVPTDATAVMTQAPAGRRKGLYYNRWRWYDAQAGRFVSEDMNGAGMAGSESLAYFGNASDVTVESYAAMTQLGDGLSLFAYLASSPLMGTDAAGLEGWWDEDIDNEIADRAGQAMYVVGTLNEGARMISLGLNTTLDIAAGFLPGSGLYDAFKSVQVVASGQGGFWDAVNIAMAAIPIVKGAMTGIRSLSKAAGWGRRACNSFVAGTLITTPFGPVPIEHLRPGDWVVSRYEVDQGGALVVRRVSETIVGQAEQILWITLADGVSIGLTQQHEVWVAGRGGIPACELVVGDALLRADGAGAQVVDLVLDESSTPVFNLEVDGTATYFAEGEWVHNDSCTITRAAGYWVHAHHLIPKFLQGWMGGRVRELPDFLHREYHRFLNDALARHNLPLRGNSPTRDWAELLQDPEMAARAKAALIEATDEFDRARSIGLLPDLLQEMRRQGW